MLHRALKRLNKLTRLWFLEGIKEFLVLFDGITICHASNVITYCAFKAALIVANREGPLSFKKSIPTSGAKAKMGISARSLDEGKPGLVITRVSAGSGADTTGLKKGDVLLDVDEHSIQGLGDLMQFLRKRNPGDMVKVRYLRGDEENQIEVILGD